MVLLSEKQVAAARAGGGETDACGETGRIVVAVGGHVHVVGGVGGEPAQRELVADNVGDGGDRRIGVNVFDGVSRDRAYRPVVPAEHRARAGDIAGTQFLDYGASRALLDGDVVHPSVMGVEYGRIGFPAESDITPGSRVVV